MKRRSRNLDRRRFFRSTAAAAGAISAPWVLPCSALGRDGAVPPGERIALGFLGPGNRGRGLMKVFVPRPEVETVAISDVIAAQRDRAMATLAELIDRSKPGRRACKTYIDFREILDRRDVDAVVVSAPEHWRAIMCIMAAKAGKDIYTEKPFSLTVKEGKAMVDAVRRYGRVFQHGTQRRAWESVRKAAELARNGRLGRLTHATCWVGPGPKFDIPDRAADVPPPNREVFDWDLWLGPAPWRPFPGKHGMGRWQQHRDFGIGSIANWGSHTLDHAQWALGKDDEGPVEILPPTADDSRTALTYADGLIVYRYPTPVDSSNAAVFGSDGQKVVLGTPPIEDKYDRTPLAVDEIHLYRCESDDFYGDWLRCIRTRKKPLCHEEVGYRSGSLCQLIAISDQLQRPLRYDPVQVEFPDDDQANRLLDTPKRAPWRLS